VATAVSKPDLIFPPALVPGSVVRVIAPASPFETRLVWRAMGWLAQRYDVRYSRGIFARDGFLAGNDERRKAELASALTEPGIAAIFCARGGYGLSRYAHQIDWLILRDDPRWICGFSDVTAIHVEAHAVGVATMHCANVTALGRGDAQTREELVRTLEAPATPRRFDNLHVLCRGEAIGRLCGGNLTLLHACAAAGRLRLPKSCVLLIEDVTELPYRIDRMLTTLRVGGAFDDVAAVVVGEFTRCPPGADGTTVDEVLSRCLSPLGIPVVCGLPIGHGLDNAPVVIGAPTRVVAGDQSHVELFG
jgi:muramoyltetrapeptide carboxypeptidase